MSSDDNKLYIYTKQSDLNDGYWDVPNIIGVWNDKFELMRYINNYRKTKWYDGVNTRTYLREIMIDPHYDFGIYDTEPYPELYITVIDMNRGCWMQYDDLVSESSNTNDGWETFSQKEFFKTFGNQPLWKPSEDELDSVRTLLHTEKTKDMDKEDKTRFVNLYKKFKEKGIIDEVLSGENLK